jgi:hypothetical protein
MKSSISMDIMPCNSLKVNLRFGGICLLHLQGRRERKARNQHEVDLLATWVMLVFARLVLSPEGGDTRMFFRNVD